MKSKPILRPERLRHVPRQFNWIDQRLVGDRHITRCRSDALALYLLLTAAVLDRLLHHAETVIIEATDIHKALRQVPAATLKLQTS